MKLSLDEKTLIIIGLFIICFLFINNLKEDDKKFYNSIMIEEEENINKEFFQDTSSSNNESMEQLIENSGNSVNTTTTPEESVDRETAFKKFKLLKQKNESKLRGLINQSNQYHDNISNLKNNNLGEKNKIQQKLIKNLISGNKNELKPEEDYNSFLNYNGNMLRNSLLNTASDF